MSLFLMVIQLSVTVIMGVYFFSQLKQQKKAQPAITRENGKEMDELKKMRNIRLTEPLAEHVRPVCFKDIIGQEEGIKSLQAILYGENPQHVILYGPPGIGKTCAARLALEGAKKSKGTPFKKDAPFIEIDATCVRFDERSIADPLLGSVHDPIYQGAGQLGVQGIPQPKKGAVTRAHGGVLFLDEIGELHPIQMNKLLKVLEDRRVMLESAYYNKDDQAVPKYIHDIFKNGLPADFRLVGATTRNPEDISPALRSRCMEIFFKPLERDEVSQIAYEASVRAKHEMEKPTSNLIGQYAACGRDAVNMVQMASGVAALEDRNVILRKDVEWVIESGHYQMQPNIKANTDDKIGNVHGLAVFGTHQGAVMEIEAVVKKGTGDIKVTGIVEEEEITSKNQVMKRPSTARASIENVKTVLKQEGILTDHKDVHINFPGGMPVDGPSAGIAMALVAISALKNLPLDGKTGITGEISITGEVRPVGGVPEKVMAAQNAGLERVLIPAQNYLERFEHMNIHVQKIHTIFEAMDILFKDHQNVQISEEIPAQSKITLVAAPKA